MVQLRLEPDNCAAAVVGAAGFAFVTLNDNILVGQDGINGICSEYTEQWQMSYLLAGDGVCSYVST